VDDFAEQLSDKPNSLIFAPRQTPDPEPRAN
jgi:hypothetical protein